MPVEVWHQLCVLDTASAAYGVQNTGQRDVHCIQFTGGTAQPLRACSATFHCPWKGPWKGLNRGKWPRVGRRSHNFPRSTTFHDLPRPVPQQWKVAEQAYASWHADSRVWSHVPIWACARRSSVLFVFSTPVYSVPTRYTLTCPSSLHLAFHLVSRADRADPLQRALSYLFCLPRTEPPISRLPAHPLRTKRSGRTATAVSLLEFLWLPSRRGGLARPLWSRCILAYAKCATTGRF
jgi:hypothetical protein